MSKSRLYALPRSSQYRIFPQTSLPRRLNGSSHHRSFHASPRQQIVTEALSASHDVLQALHTLTSTQWCFTLPVFALIVRTTFVLPISIYQRRALQRQVQLQPVLQAWHTTIQARTMKEYGHLGPEVAGRALLKETRKKRRELYSRWRCGFWKNWLGTLQLPVWLCAIETVRKMTGSSRGLLGHLFEGKEGSVPIQDGSSLLEGTTYTPAIPIEPTLATEGMLWFPNLLVADPYLILPFVLSGTILLNIFGDALRRPDAVRSKGALRLRRSLGVVALAAGPLMLHVPSALLLYWISSSSLGFLYAEILNRMMPLKPAPKICKPKRPWSTGLGKVPEEETQR